ncbi:MAG: hypothetical protein ACRCWB_07095, partial [Enterovibrio sp.]
IGKKAQQPILRDLEQSLSMTQEQLMAINSVMNWKFMLSFSLTILLALVICCGALTYFLDRGYSRIDAMRAMEREWQAKAPLANIITCDGKPCVQIKGNQYTDKEGNRYYQIK